MEATVAHDNLVPEHPGVKHMDMVQFLRRARVPLGLEVARLVESAEEAIALAEAELEVAPVDRASERAGSHLENVALLGRILEESLF